MRATILVPTHGFWVEASEAELFEIIARNRLNISGWKLHEAIAAQANLDKDDALKGIYGFFLSVEGHIEFGDKQHFTYREGSVAKEIDSYEFVYFEELQSHHRNLLRDPNVQKAMNYETVFIPRRIDGTRFCGYEEFARLGSVPALSASALSDDELAWEILRRMDSVIANEANTYNEFEFEWYERRENFISIEPKFFPSAEVTLSELRARWMRAKSLISEFTSIQWDSEYDSKIMTMLEAHDLDTLLEIAFLDYHGGEERRVSKIAGDVFLRRLPDSKYLFK